MNKHPMVALILEKMRKGKGPAAGPDDDEGGESDEGAEEAAQEMLGAIHDEDPKALASALTSFVKACMDNYGG